MTSHAITVQYVCTVQVPAPTSFPDMYISLRLAIWIHLDPSSYQKEQNLKAPQVINHSELQLENQLISTGGFDRKIRM